MMNKIVILISVFIFSLNSYSQEKKDNFYKASAYIYYNILDSAVIYMSKSIDSEKDNYSNYIVRGNCYFNLKMYESALNDYLKANDLKTGAGEYSIARCYSMLSNYDKAFDYLQRHLQKSEKNTQASIKLDTAFRNINTLKQWDEIWLTEWYSKTETALFDAEYAINKKQYYEALDILTQLIEKRSRSHQAYFLRAKASTELQSYRAALTDIEKAIEIAPKNDNYWFEKGKLNLHEEKYKKAYEDFNTAINLNPDNLVYNLFRAKSAIKIENYAVALDDMKLYMKYYGREAEENYIIGLIYLNQKEYIDALPYLNIALAKDQSKYEYFTSRGIAYLNTNSPALSESDFTMSLDLNPKQNEVWFFRGLNRSKLGNSTGACLDWEKAFDMKYVDAVEYLKKNCWK